MKQRLPQIQNISKHCFNFFRLFFIATIVVSVIFAIYTIIICFIPANSFESFATNSGIQIINKQVPFGLATSVPSTVIVVENAITASAKTIHVVSLLVLIVFSLFPFVLSMHYIKDTFFNIAYGNKPFTKESSHNLKSLGIIIISCSLLIKPIWACMLAIFATKSLSLQLSVEFLALFAGGLCIVLAYLFNYLCELYEENLSLKESSETVEIEMLKQAQEDCVIK